MPDLAGRRVVVTAGGTREPIDPVRYLGNRSSGKMGNAVARAAADAGADVVLITTKPFHDAEIHVIRVETADEMHAAVRDALAPGAILVMAAAVADFRPRQMAPRKIKKSDAGLVLDLVPTVDILASIAHDAMRDHLYVVGFAAETDDAVANGIAKARDKRLDLCVINDVSRPGIGMGADDNEVTVVAPTGVITEISKRPKADVATALVTLIAERVAVAR